jgi:hypothetical protein
MKIKAMLLLLTLSLTLWAQTPAAPSAPAATDQAATCSCCKNMEAGKTCADCCKDGKCAMADGKAGCCKDGKCDMAKGKGCCAGMKDGKGCCAGKDGKVAECCKQAGKGKGCCGKACMRTSKAA